MAGEWESSISSQSLTYWCRAKLPSSTMSKSSKSSALSDYELARQERIKENQKMLEELFPEGTEIIVPKASRPPPLKRRRRAADVSSLGTGSGSASVSENSGDEEGEPPCSRAKNGYRIRYADVIPCNLCWNLCWNLLEFSSLGLDCIYHAILMCATECSLLL